MPITAEPFETCELHKESRGAAVERARSLIDQHRTAHGLEGDDETILFHVLCDLIALCGAQDINIVSALREAAEHVAAHER